MWALIGDKSLFANLPDQKDEEKEVGKQSREVHNLRRFENNAAFEFKLIFSFKQGIGLYVGYDMSWKTQHNTGIGPT